MSRNAKLVAAAALMVIVVVVLAVTYLQDQQLSPQDNAMKATARRFAAALRASDARYAALPDSLQAFNLFQHDQQTILAKRMKELAGPGEFAQIQVWETKTMPPQSLILHSTTGPIVNLGGNLVSKADSGKDGYATVSQKGVEYRAYLTAIRPPPTIRSLGAHEILEVFRSPAG